jgi:NSS family neurotransmitter:Na+ symporter
VKRTALSMSIAETLVAVIAGLAIVPAAISVGIELESGPPLIFIAVPTILQGLPLGSLFGVMFFALLFLAAFLSVVAAYEVVVAAMVDGFDWSRRRATWTFCTIGLLLGIPAVLNVDYIVTSDLFWGSVMHPVGSVLAMVALVWVVGQARALEEVNRGNSGRPVSALWIFWLRWVVPTGIIIILALGVRDLFAAF